MKTLKQTVMHGHSVRKMPNGKGKSFTWAANFKKESILMCLSIKILTTKFIEIMDKRGYQVH